MRKYETFEVWFCDGSRVTFYGYEIEKFADKYGFSAHDFINSPNLDINLYDDDGCMIGGVQAI